MVSLSWFRFSVPSGISAVLRVGNPLVFKIMLASALCIVAARTIGPFEVGKDQALQLESAQRLVAGLGLTSTYFVTQPADISEPASAQFLTWWPPGFSLLVAGFLITGLPLAVVLKLLYGVTTLIGWSGWAILGSHFLGKPCQFKGRIYHLNVLFAALFPVAFTPLWNGTDIFLWAGIPFFFLLLSDSRQSHAAASSVAIAGLLLGALYSIRYVSLFLLPASLLILLQIHFRSLRSYVKNILILMATSSIGILATILYVRFYSIRNTIVPQVVTLPDDPFVIPQPETILKIRDTLLAAPVVSNLIFGFPIIHELVHLSGSWWLRGIVGSICLLVLLFIPFGLALSRSNRNVVQQRLALSLSSLPLSLVVFLLAVSYWSGLGLFAELRYYLPLSLCVVFIFYWVASSRTGLRMLRTLATMVVLSLVLYLCGYFPAQALLPRKRDDLVRSTLGLTLRKSEQQSRAFQSLSYPSFGFHSFKAGSRQKLIELQTSNPDAIFFVDNYSFYIFDNLESSGLQPGRNFRRLPKRRTGFWETAYTSKSLKVFWVVDSPRLLSFLPEQSRTLVFSEPVEKTQIYTSTFPAGFQFPSVQLARQMR